MTEDDRETVFSRWSRRKLAVKEQDDPAQTADTELAPEEQLPEAVEPAEPEPPLLTDADMPDIDTLTEESDYSPFMSHGVSEELRKLALRKMFRASVFNVRDGLDEYDDDFTTFEKLGDVVTADMKHRIEMEQQKLREKLQAENELEQDEMEVIDDDQADEEIDVQAGDQQQGNLNSGENTSPAPGSEEDIDEQR